MPALLTRMCAWPNNRLAGVKCRFHFRFDRDICELKSSADFLRHRRTVTPPVGNQHVHTVFTKPPGDGQPDAGTAAGDNR